MLFFAYAIPPPTYTEPDLVCNFTQQFLMKLGISIAFKIYKFTFSCSHKAELASVGSQRCCAAKNACTCDTELFGEMPIERDPDTNGLEPRVCEFRL